MIPFIDSKLLIQKEVKAKCLLVKEGQIADSLFFIERGSVRAWFNNGGKETTLQFFFAQESVTSLESFLEGKPSNINIETMEACTVTILQREDFLRLLQVDPQVKAWFLETAVKKLVIHTNRLLFLLQHKPYDRYKRLLADSPELLQKVPQQYIASYLGMTAVSLSRIKSRG